MILHQGKSSSSAESKAYRFIIGMILKGDIKPGVLLLEADLSERMRMSRTPVGRALSRLVSEGFLEKLPKKGCFVPIPSADDAVKAFDAREMVEFRTAYLAAKHATPDEIEGLEQIVSMDAQAVATFSRELYADANEAFHLGIARMSRNAYLERWCRYIFWRSSVYIFYFDSFYMAADASKAPQQDTPEQHAAVVRAIAAGDAQAAGEAMAEHCRSTFAKIFRRV